MFPKSKQHRLNLKKQVGNATTATTNVYVIKQNWREKILKNANVVEKKSASKTAKAMMDYAGNAGTTN